MYTMIDEALAQQWASPIRPRKTDQPRSSGENRARPPKKGEPEYAPWRVPFPTEEEWQGFLSDLLDELEAHPDAHALFVGVLERLRLRQESSR